MTSPGYMLVATISEKGAVIPDGTTIFVTADGVISVDAAQLIPIPGTEGDLYYFHSGAVHFLHIGAAGKVLTSDGTDPGWQETVLPMAANGVLVGTRHKLDIDNSSGDIAITATDDAIADAVHYDFDLSAAIKAALGVGKVVTFYSDTTIKMIALATANNTNNAPPAGWQNPSFDDAAWSDGTISAGDNPSLIPGAHFIDKVTAFTGAGILGRKHFTLPAGTIASATLHLSCDDNLEALAMNGTSVDPGVTLPFSFGLGTISTVLTIDVPVGDLVAGADNVLAIWSQNDNIDTVGGQDWRLDVTYTASIPEGGGLPAGTEGDILYFHDGAWVVLHIGPAFSVLQSNGADPVYGDVPVQWEAAGTLEAVRGKANFIAGSNTAITVADNAGADRVDITVASNPLPPGRVGSSQSGKASIGIAAGAASATAAIVFSPAFSAAPNVLVSSSDGRLIASAESVTSTGFTARLTANVPLAPGTSITATLYWSVSASAPTGRHKVLWLAQYR